MKGSFITVGLMKGSFVTLGLMKGSFVKPSAMKDPFIKPRRKGPAAEADHKGLPAIPPTWRSPFSTQ
jgi:hypothetical protein